MSRSLLVTLLTALYLTATPDHMPAAEGFFLAIGGINGKADDGHLLEGQFGTIYRSIDGEKWTLVFKGGPVTEGFNHAKNNLLRCATYGNGRFVVTGNPKAVIVSEDGSKWRIAEAPSGSMSVEYGNGVFLAPNAAGFMVSTDGLKWETRKPEVDFRIWGKDGAGHVRKTVFGNGVFVCVGEQRIGVTKDGTAWLHHRVLPEAQRPGRSILLFGNGRFVWLCEKTGPLSSIDGITWEPITTFGELSEKAKFGQSGVFDGKQFLTSPSAWSDKNKIIYASHDGAKWTPAIEHAQSTSFSTAGNGRLLQNQGWSKSFSVSADGGKTWKQIKADIPSRKVYFFNGERIIGQSGG